MKKIDIKSLLIVLSVAGLFISCASFNSAQAEGELHYYNTVSQGQQLLDLKEAYDKRIITKSEYDTLKTRIMNNTIDIPEIMGELKKNSD